MTGSSIRAGRNRKMKADEAAQNNSESNTNERQLNEEGLPMEENQDEDLEEFILLDELDDNLVTQNDVDLPKPDDGKKKKKQLREPTWIT